MAMRHYIFFIVWCCIGIVHWPQVFAQGGCMKTSGLAPDICHFEPIPDESIGCSKPRPYNPYIYHQPTPWQHASYQKDGDPKQSAESPEAKGSQNCDCQNCQKSRHAHPHAAEQKTTAGEQTKSPCSCPQCQQDGHTQKTTHGSGRQPEYKQGCQSGGCQSGGCQPGGCQHGGCQAGCGYFQCGHKHCQKPLKAPFIYQGCDCGQCRRDHLKSQLFASHQNGHCDSQNRCGMAGCDQCGAKAPVAQKSDGSKCDCAACQQKQDCQKSNFQKPTRQCGTDCGCARCRNHRQAKGCGSANTCQLSSGCKYGLTCPKGYPYQTTCADSCLSDCYGRKCYANRPCITPGDWVDCFPCNKPCYDPWRLINRSFYGFDVTGWLNAGYTYNADQPVSRFNGPFNWVDRDELAFNQGYLSIENPIEDCLCGFDIGGRADVLFGTDSRFVQARGLELDPAGNRKWNGARFYGIAVPQVYAELGYNNISLKVGHFYSPIGYESVMAPENFFYSRSYSMQFGRAQTLTGALGKWDIANDWELVGGVHNGWDNFDPTVNYGSVMGGVRYVPECRPYTVSLIGTSGNEATSGFILTNNTAYAERMGYALVFDWQVTDRIEYVFEHLLGVQRQSAPDGAEASWYGVTQYLYYAINPCWKLGVRGEWFRDNNGTRVAGSPYSGNPNQGPFTGNFSEVSGGVNWLPSNNLVVRTEMRWDWYDGTGLPFDDGSRVSQFTMGVDAILHY